MTFPPDHVPTLSDVDAELCRRSLSHFVRAAWANSPRALALGSLVWNWHLDAICLHLEAVARGDIRNLLVNVPPGSTKTELISIFFLPWVWTWRPGYKAIFASKIEPLAIDASVKCREVIESEWYQNLFVIGRGPVVDGRPTDAWELRDDKNAKTDFANTVGGSRFATGVGGTAIGRHAHVIVGDDLQDDKQSPAEWRATLQYWSGTLSSRAVDPATVAKICVQQRLGKGDLSEALIASGLFVHLCLPMRYGRGPANTNVTRYPDGRELWRDPRTKPDELLNPRQLPEPQATQTYVTEKMTYGLGVGPVKYKAQYDQNPANEEGGAFKRSWWRFYRDPLHPEWSGRPEGCATHEEAPTIEIPRDIELVYLQSADTALKDKQANDASCAGIGCYERERPARVFIRDVVHDRVTFEGLIALVLEQRKKWKLCTQTYIEDKASGISLIQVLQPRVSGIVGVDPGSASKADRARLNTLPRLEAGQIYLPEGAPWLEYVIGEHADFPGGDHDDSVDMLSQMMSKAEGVRGDLDMVDALAKW